MCAHACLQPSLTETIHILWYNVHPTNYFQILSYDLIFWIFGSDTSHLRNMSIHVYAYVGLHLYLYVSRLLVGNFVFVHIDPMFKFRGTLYISIVWFDNASIPYPTIHNIWQNAHISVPKWDMGQVHYGIFEIDIILIWRGVIYLIWRGVI